MDCTYIGHHTILQTQETSSTNHVATIKPNHRNISIDKTHHVLAENSPNRICTLGVALNLLMQSLFCNYYIKTENMVVNQPYTLHTNITYLFVHDTRGIFFKKKIGRWHSLTTRGRQIPLNRKCFICGRLEAPSLEISPLQ